MLDFKSYFDVQDIGSNVLTENKIATPLMCFSLLKIKCISNIAGLQ